MNRQYEDQRGCGIPALTIGVVTLLIMVAFLSGCNSTKHVTTNRHSSEVTTQTDATTTATATPQETTNTKITATTTTTEDVDTVVTAYVPTGKVSTDEKVKIAYQTVQVPVRIRRTTSRTEYQEQAKVRSEQAEVKQQVSQDSTAKTTTVSKVKDVKRSYMPLIIWVVVILAVVVVVWWKRKEIAGWIASKIP